jgi:VIT1/CCC1 family predicted Fe2+/Mn2+ transporter
VIEVIIEIVGELLIQVVGEVLIEAGFQAVGEPLRRRPKPLLAALGYLIFGAALGSLSLLIFPTHLTPAGIWRVANLVVAPLIAGLSMAALGAWRARRGDLVFRIDRFSYGYLFALAMALVRYFFAH